MEKTILLDEIHFRRGDILIESDDYGNCKGELKIALKDFKNTGESNIIAKNKQDEVFILDYIKPYQKFNFIADNV